MIRKLTYIYTPTDNTDELIKKNEELQAKISEIEAKHIILDEKITTLEKATK